MELDKEGAPGGPRGRGRPVRDPDDELTVDAQQRLGLPALSPTVALPAGPLNVIGGWNVAVAKPMTSQQSP
jgi:hypothetical protein